MCGINGIFAYHPAAVPPTEAELLATREAMRARGPNGAGAWWSGDRRCALANRRLAIQDLSERSAQPMISIDGATVVTFNGEIYNCRELRAQLEADGAHFCTTGDTEVLLHLYARDGAAMVRHLRGMFAFAIWDETRRELFLARDPYGIKPLYTVNDGWTFRFASQVKALLAGGRVSREGEPAGIVGFYLFGSVPEPFTLYRDIRALPAGHTQLVDAAGPHESKPYANLAAILAEGAAHPAPAGELHERLRAAALDSTRAHLVADVDVGVFLSAGVDSGALLGFVQEAGVSGVRAITLAFDEFRGTPQDEAPLASRTASRYGLPHLVRRIGEREFRNDLPAILEAMDQPSIDGVNTWFVAKAAKEAGLKAALSGIGGDELLAGYPSFVDVPRWRRRFGPVAAVPGLGRLARLLIQSCLHKSVWSKPKSAAIFEQTNRWAGAYFLRRGLFMAYELPNLMDPALARVGLRRLRHLHSLDSSLVPNPGSDVGRVCALESAHYLRNQLLRDADWAGMAHSIEIRVPYVDTTLLTAIAPLLPSLRPGAGKAALVDAPAVPLPGEVVERYKTGFGVPIGAWEDRAAGTGTVGSKQNSERPGLVSRRWCARVLSEFAWQRPAALRRDDVSRILIFRIGSLGDTIVALPSLHLVARCFPEARRILITNMPSAPKVASAESVLGGSGLIDETIYFSEAPRRFRQVLQLRAQIRRTRTTLLVYIADRKLWPTLRDRLYFQLCGVRHFIGFPLSADLRALRVDPATGEREREVERLLRCLGPLGTVDLHDPSVWDLRLLSGEHAAAETALLPLEGRDFIGLSIGTKWRVNDWGDANWSALLSLLGSEWSDLGLVLVGAGAEFERSAKLAVAWPGPTLNLCGHLQPRESGAVLQKALAFLGHDSGPVHLAAAVGTPCIAVFGERNPPKKWHPVGDRHRVIHNMRGVQAISPTEMRDEASRAIAAELTARECQIGAALSEERVAAT